MRFSIVIPTYNRSEKLTACLNALLHQRYDPSQYEVVVVDDGSTDETLKVLEKISKKSRVPVRFFLQPNQGQGVARNAGVREAKGEIVLLLGDDIVSTPELLAEHDRAHTWYPQENAAVLGFVTWLPGLAVSPLMQFMERGGAIFGRYGGHQFAYDLLRGKKTADYHFFYTANISLKRFLLKRFPFDPWFAGYGWEDIELGYRLQTQAGMTLYYQPSAIAYHDHMMTEKDFANRMRNIGESSLLFHRKYPMLGMVPSARKRAALRMLSHPLAMKLVKPVWRNLYFYALSKKYFLEGLERSL